MRPRICPNRHRVKWLSASWSVKHRSGHKLRPERNQCCRSLDYLRRRGAGTNLATKTNRALPLRRNCPILAVGRQGLELWTRLIKRPSPQITRDHTDALNEQRLELWPEPR